MNTNHDFVAERPLAQHCPELVRAGPGEEELGVRFADFGADLAKALTPSLSTLISGQRIRISCSGPERLASSVLAERVGPIGANALVRFAGTAAQLAASIEARHILAITDRVFGGNGEVSESAAQELPLTASFVIGTIEAALCTALDAATGGLRKAEIGRRAENLAKLDSVAKQAMPFVLALNVEQEGHDNWTVLLSADATSLAALFSDEPAAARSPAVRRPANPLGEPFGDVPLPVEAVIAELVLPLARVSALHPGAVIPLALARDVPLRVGGIPVAQGEVGTKDDRVALQINRIY